MLCATYAVHAKVDVADQTTSFISLSRLIGGADYRLIYRHYATLYFVFCVDSSESELGILDLIQVGILHQKLVLP